MKKRTKWQKKLTVKEIKHVNEWCGGTLRGLNNARIMQEADRIRESRDAGHDVGERCWECRAIAKKLDLE